LIGLILPKHITHTHIAILRLWRTIQGIGLHDMHGVSGKKTIIPE
jgi:hypothetical protein